MCIMGCYGAVGNLVCRTWESLYLAFPRAVKGIIHDGIACHAYSHKAGLFIFGSEWRGAGGRPVVFGLCFFTEHEYWSKGYYVDTARKNAGRIAEYIANQLKENQLGEQLTLGTQSPFEGGG